jgi:hypothetical protein
LTLPSRPLRARRRTGQRVGYDQPAVQVQQPLGRRAHQAHVLAPHGKHRAVRVTCRQPRQQPAELGGAGQRQIQAPRDHELLDALRRNRGQRQADAFRPARVGRALRVAGPRRAVGRAGMSCAAGEAAGGLRPLGQHGVAIVVRRGSKVQDGGGITAFGQHARHPQQRVGQDAGGGIGTEGEADKGATPRVAAVEAGDRPAPEQLAPGGCQRVEAVFPGRRGLPCDARADAQAAVGRAIPVHGRADFGHSQEGRQAGGAQDDAEIPVARRLRQGPGKARRQVVEKRIQRQSVGRV